MRPIRIYFLPTALALLAACGRDNGVSVNERPPLGGVRFINAVADGGPVDIRMVDQVEWSASSVNGTAVGLAFRAGTIHWATEAKARQIRVFPTDSSIAVTTQALHDTSIVIEANKNVTLMLVGSRAAGGHISFIKIDDNPPAVPSNKIAVRLVNASAPGLVPSAADAYIVTDTTAAGLPATATYTAVAPRSAAPYVLRDPGLFAFRATSAGSTTPFWATTAPAGAAANGLIGVAAGYNGGGSAFSAYLFPRSVAGTAAPQSSAFQAPALIYFVDFIPAPPQ